MHYAIVDRFYYTALSTEFSILMAASPASSSNTSAPAHLAKTPSISSGAGGSSVATIKEQIVDGEIDTTDTKARYLALLGMLKMAIGQSLAMNLR